MSERIIESSQRGPAEVDQILRGIRFALVCIVVGLSYFSIRVAAAVPKFQLIFGDLLEGAALPWVTTAVLQWRHLFLIASCIFPLVAIWTMFGRVRARSFYIIGAMTLATIIQTVILTAALAKPLVQMVVNWPRLPVQGRCNSVFNRLQGQDIFRSAEMRSAREVIIFQRVTSPTRRFRRP